jgi:hypothetical protein
MRVEGLAMNGDEPDQPKRHAGGRPRLDPSGQPSVMVGVRVRAADFDRLYHEARRARMTIAEFCRRAIVAQTRQTDR